MKSGKQGKHHQSNFKSYIFGLFWQVRDIFPGIPEQGYLDPCVLRGCLLLSPCAVTAY